MALTRKEKKRIVTVGGSLLKAFVQGSKTKKGGGTAGVAATPAKPGCGVCGGK